MPGSDLPLRIDKRSIFSGHADWSADVVLGTQASLPSGRVFLYSSRRELLGPANDGTGNLATSAGHWGSGNRADALELVALGNGRYSFTDLDGTPVGPQNFELADRGNDQFVLKADDGKIYLTDYNNGGLLNSNSGLIHDWYEFTIDTSAPVEWTEAGIGVGPTAGLMWSPELSYFMRGDEYILYDVDKDLAVQEPRITSERWSGWPAGSCLKSADPSSPAAMSQ